jgi:hypothetical protein
MGKEWPRSRRPEEERVDSGLYSRNSGQGHRAADEEKLAEARERYGRRARGDESDNRGDRWARVTV